MGTNLRKSIWEENFERSINELIESLKKYKKINEGASPVAKTEGERIYTLCSQVIDDLEKYHEFLERAKKIHRKKRLELPRELEIARLVLDKATIGKKLEKLKNLFNEFNYTPSNFQVWKITHGSLTRPGLKKSLLIVVKLLGNLAESLAPLGGLDGL